MLKRWSMRRRILVFALVILAVRALAAPLWLGYFGPDAAAYASIWRPWRTHLTLRHENVYDVSSGRVAITANYRDPWPGQARNPGWQFDFMQLRRSRSWLPWVVTAHGSGP
jgi:hypothetical protein